MLGLAQVGLEHFQLKADAACLAAEQEFRVGKREAISVCVQGVAVDCVVLQFRPGIGQAAFVELGIGVHKRLFVSVCREKKGAKAAATGFGSGMQWRMVCRENGPLGKSTMRGLL